MHTHTNKTLNCCCCKENKAIKIFPTFFYRCRRQAKEMSEKTCDSLLQKQGHRANPKVNDLI